jgi:acyl-CoA reductase-like NAD-dependent aldehyde dehydrogenase
VRGNPLKKPTTLGPMVNAKRADFVRTQIVDAIKAGATPLVDENKFAASKAGTPYLAPQVLINVDHSMSLMRDESFGPVVGIMKVDNDAQAIALMNDSDYGLTASIWSQDETRAIEIGQQIDTGTVFMNRCDYLDPALAWVGVKKSGRGCSLSKLGYAQLTRPKSFHLKKAIHE